MEPDASVTSMPEPFKGATMSRWRSFVTHSSRTRVLSLVSMTCAIAWDPDEVFDDSTIDAVVIGSPTQFHVDHILKAVNSGKRVMCEKPIALDVESAKRCINELGDRADQVMMGFNRRFDPTFSALKSRLDDGEIGSLQQLTVISPRPGSPVGVLHRGVRGHLQGYDDP